MKCEETTRLEERYRELERQIVQKIDTTAAACKQVEDEAAATNEHAEGHNEATAAADKGRNEATAAAGKKKSDGEHTLRSQNNKNGKSEEEEETMAFIGARRTWEEDKER